MPSLDLGTRRGQALPGNLQRGGILAYGPRTTSFDPTQNSGTNSVLASSLVVPARTLVPGDILRARLRCIVNNTSGGSRTFSMKFTPFMPAAASFTTALASANVRSLEAQIDVLVTAAAVQQIEGWLAVSASGAADGVAPTDAARYGYGHTNTIDLTAAQTLDLQLITSSTTGTQTTTIQRATIEIIPAGALGTWPR